MKYSELISEFIKIYGSSEDVTGGGFGGCNISIVRKDCVEQFMQTVKEE